MNGEIDLISMLESDEDSTPHKDVSFLSQIDFLIHSHSQRLNWDEYFMSMALLISIRSSCHRLHVGCIIVKNNRVISAGYNGFIAGLPHHSVVRDGHEQNTVHAEQNAIVDAARRGVSLEGSTAYVTHYPCIHCAKLLAASGISNIYYHHDYKNNEIVEEILSPLCIPINRV